MINLSKSGDTIVFEFINNGHYLENGTIEVPVNSLSLVIDSSNMATFKKASSNDVFIAATYDELGMTKAELETFYKENMAGSTGGGGDITSGEVQTMIDESISGKADTSAVTESINAAVSGKADISDIPDVSNYFDGAEYDSGTTRINFYHGNTVKAYIDASAFIVDGMVDDVRIETISGVTYLVIDFNTASGKEDIQIPITDIFDASNYYNKSEIDSIESGLKNSIDEKLDASAYTPTDLSEYWTSAQTETAISNATSGKADTSAVTESINAAVSGKVDTSAITSSVTSASTDSQVPSAKAVYDVIDGKQDQLIAGSGITISGNVISADGGGGKAVSAGTNISVTTGETADTISCTLPIISNGSNRYKGFTLASEGANNYVDGQTTYATVLGTNNVAQNSRKSIFVCGDNNISSLDYGFACGRYNQNNVGASTTFGDSGNTLFSVGNGTAWNARHNAFEIRQNGDIYITSGGTDIKLQDNLGGGGGKAIEAGRGISITTGETADTVSFNLPISAGTGNGSLIIGDNGNTSYASVANGLGAVVFPGRPYYGGNKADGEASFAHGSQCSASTSSHAEGSRTKCTNTYNSHSEGDNTEVRGMSSHSEGENTLAGADYTIKACHAEGIGTSAMTSYSHAEGSYTKTTNKSEHASGQYNNSVSASTTFGNSGNTLFSVGNGTSNSNRHNAFEIRQNGDIYITKDGQDVKLQDHLGGTVSSAITSGDTNAVAGGAVYEQLGGLKLVKLTQAQYDALAPNYDNNTLYVIKD